MGDLLVGRKIFVKLADIAVEKNQGVENLLCFVFPLWYETAENFTFFPGECHDVLQNQPSSWVDLENITPYKGTTFKGWRDTRTINWYFESVLS